MHKNTLVIWIQVCGLLVCCVVGVCASVGCERDEIHTYKAPKASTKIQPVGMTPPHAPAGHTSMRWVVPDGWRQVPGQREMRIATFETTGGVSPVEVVVASFPGQAGGLLPNVNRWRGQLNLQPISGQELAGQLTPFTNDQVRGYTLDFTGASGDSQKRIVGAIIFEGATKTWFIKAMDSPSVLEPHRDTVWRFAKSFQLAGGAQDSSSLTSEGNGPVWHVPNHWVRDPSPSSVVLAAFNISNDAGDARVTITGLSGDGGGMLLNINRWRGQLGLPSVPTLDEQPVVYIDNPSGVRLAVIDLLSPKDDQGHGRERYVIAMVWHQQKSWFFKLTGPEGAVEKEKDAFERFVRSTVSP